MAGCPGPWASGRAGREDGHGPLLVAGDQPLSRSGPGGGGEHRAQVEVCTWSGAMSPQSRTTRGQAELLPRESQSWVTHPAPIQADTHICLSLSPPAPSSRDYFSYSQKGPPLPPGQHGHVPWRGGRRQCQLWSRTPTREGDWGLGRKVWEVHVCEKEPEKRTGRRPFPVHLRSLVAWTSLQRSRRQKQGESDPR